MRKNYDKIFKKNKNNLFKWVHDFNGTNLRMTEVQAAVGIEQLKNLKKMINIRFKNIQFIYKNIKKIILFLHQYYLKIFFILVIGVI